MNSTITPQHSPADLTPAIRALAKMQSMVRRVEVDGYGRNAAATQNGICRHFEAALKALVAIEDEHGADACAAQSDKLTELRQRAMAVGAISTSDLTVIERRACA